MPTGSLSSSLIPTRGRPVKVVPHLMNAVKSQSRRLRCRLGASSAGLSHVDASRRANTVTLLCPSTWSQTCHLPPRFAVGPGVGTGVAVSVGTGVAVGVGAGVAVGVGKGMAVGVGAGVGVGEGTSVAVGVGAGVAVGTGVTVGTEVGVGTAVGTKVGVAGAAIVADTMASTVEPRSGVGVRDNSGAWGATGLHARHTKITRNPTTVCWRWINLGAINLGTDLAPCQTSCR